MGSPLIFEATVCVHPAAWTAEVTELVPVLLSAPCCRFKLWSAAPPRSEKGLTYAFLCYTAAGLEAPHLPPAVASQHEEKQVSCCAERTAVEFVRSGATCSWMQDLWLALSQCPGWGMHLCSSFNIVP